RIGEIGEREAGLAAAEVVLPLAGVPAAAETAAAESTERGTAESARADAEIGQGGPLAAPAAAASATATAAAAARRHDVVRCLLWRIARAAHRAVVLHVAVDVVGHLVVDRHVIHLADRQPHARRRRARVISRDAHATI